MKTLMEKLIFITAALLYSLAIETVLAHDAENEIFEASNEAIRDRNYNMSA